MNEFLRIFLAIFACYRLSQLLVIDNGPFDIFLVIRRKAGILASEDVKWAKEISNLLTCPYCVGMWMSLLLSMFILIPNPAFDFILLILGLAGAQTFLQSISDKNE